MYEIVIPCSFISDGDDAKDSSKRNYRSRRSASGSPEPNNKVNIKLTEKFAPRI